MQVKYEPYVPYIYDVVRKLKFIKKNLKMILKIIYNA